MNKITLIIFIIIILLFSFQISAENCLILNFDDGYSGVYLNAFTIMKKHDIPGVFFVTTSFINNKNHVNIQQLKILKNHGWEIGSHTVHHPDLLKLTTDGIKKEIIESKQYLFNKGLLNNHYASFCSPMAKWNDNIADIVGENYQIARCNRLINLNDNKEIDASIKVILRTTTLDSIKKWINTAQKKNIPIILVFHEINGNNNDLYNYSPDKFTALIDYIVQNNIKATTYSNLFKNNHND